MGQSMVTLIHSCWALGNQAQSIKGNYQLTIIIFILFEKAKTQKLKECRLQGAIIGHFSSYCVHLPVCNLQTVKYPEKVSHLRKSPQWEQLLPSTCLSEMPFSPSKLESMRTGGVTLTTGQPYLSLNPFPTLITPSPVQAFLAENTAETGQMGTNYP